MNPPHTHSPTPYPCPPLTALSYVLGLWFGGITIATQAGLVAGGLYWIATAASFFYLSRQLDVVNKKMKAEMV